MYRRPPHPLSQAKKVWEANEAERERLRKAREQEEIKVMARKAMAKPKAGQPKRKIARPKSAREAEEERVFQEAERLAKLDDDRRKVKTPGSKRAKGPQLSPPAPLQVKTPGSKRAKAVESAEDARIRQVFEQFDTNRGGRPLALLPRPLAPSSAPPPPLPTPLSPSSAAQAPSIAKSSATPSRR